MESLPTDLPVLTPAQTAAIAAFLLKVEPQPPGRALAQNFDDQAASLVRALQACDPEKTVQGMLLTLHAVFQLRADLIPKVMAHVSV